MPAVPASGIPAGGGTQPVSSVDPAGAGRLPAFIGLSSRGPQFTNGSQDIRGGDGPGASGPAGGVNGGANGLPGPAGNGSGGSGADDPAGSGGTGSSWVTVPLPGPYQQRLPIFDSLESDWFRRSGESLTAAARAQGPQAAQGVQGTAASVPPAAQGSWTSPADEGWRAAQAVAEPEAGEQTQAGLPRRVPRANLVPGSVGGGAQGSQEPAAEAPVRSPDAVRSRMSSFQRGVREGRAASPPETEES